MDIKSKSMTGFGRGVYEDDERFIATEIKAVNHRYAEIGVHMPRRYGFAEEDIKKAIRGIVRRGKLDVTVTIENKRVSDVTVAVNENLARHYYEAFRILEERFDLAGDIDLRILSEAPDVLTESPAPLNEDAVRAALISSATAAAEALNKMRIREGEKLAADIVSRAEKIGGIVEEIDRIEEELERGYFEKLRARIRQILGEDAAVPEERIALEAAIFADKATVAEELTRLRSHLKQVRGILTEEGPQGKRLDFLMQEMNREANTIASKAQDLGITDKMLLIKAEVENMREQVQNIE